MMFHGGWSGLGRGSHTWWPSQMCASQRLLRAWRLTPLRELVGLRPLLASALRADVLRSLRRANKHPGQPPLVASGERRAACLVSCTTRAASCSSAAWRCTHPGTMNAPRMPVARCTLSTLRQSAAMTMRQRGSHSADGQGNSRHAGARLPQVRQSAKADALRCRGINDNGCGGICEHQ
jgi:hypothetical protein